MWKNLQNLGQKISKPAGSLVALGGFCAYVGPQTLYLENLKDWFSTYKPDVEGYASTHVVQALSTVLRKSRNEVKVLLSPELEKKAKEVLELTTLNEREKRLTSFFHIMGCEVYHFGSTACWKGSAVGIPRIFNYQNKDQVERAFIQVKGCNHLSWATEEGDDLLETMVISDKAQRFAIAREIYNASYPVLYIYGFELTVTMAATFNLARFGNKRGNLLQKPFHLRILWYALCSFLGYVTWITLKDLTTCNMDRKCDQLAADLGPDYVRGGVEYYSKQMLRHRSLRILMGSAGSKQYTANGNVHSDFRTPSLAMSQRLDYLKSRLKEAEVKEQKARTEGGPTEEAASS